VAEGHDPVVNASPSKLLSGAASEAASVSVRGVAKVFRTAEGGNVQALDAMTLSIEAGAMVTLLRLIAGLDQPTAGELYLGTEPIDGPSAERGMMFQNSNLFPWLSVRRNIQSGLVACGVLRQRRHEVEDIMRLVGLEEFANVYPHQLSGGMAQRAALARALVNHPRVLLLDEPLGALDQFTRMRMQDELLRVWQARGTTMLLVTHDIDEAIYLCDRIAIVTPRPGRIERIIDVELPRPRQRTDPAFLVLRAAILDMLHLAGQTDDRSAGAGRETDIRANSI
jgi:ABC-type nitrate/sulfonate/bicarbonate transport system ATPase subunit